MIPELFPRIVRPPVVGGIDHGAEAWFLVRGPGGDVLWQRGYTGWYRLGETTYYPAELQWQKPGKTFSDTIREGGRLSAKLLRQHRAVINHAAGRPVTDEEIRAIVSRRAPQTLIAEEPSK